MAPREAPEEAPEDWPRLFTEHLNAGDLDGVIALYEAGATFVQQSGDTLVGRDRIRRVIAGLIATSTRLQSRVVRAVTVDDVAVLYTDFDGVTVDASGGQVDVRHHAMEVLRRQRDGKWKLIVGDPHARG